MITPTKPTITTSQKFTQLRRGLIELTILTIINSDENQFYADSIRTRLKDTEFAIPKGTLYASLLKLRKENIIRHEYGESDIGPPRKYYFLTPKGKKLLIELSQYWQIINIALEALKKTPNL